MEIQIGVAKINKYAASESGDTLEVVERPNGGLSVVLADGQRSGKSAKLISNMVVRKVITLLAEGVRDGAAARAASDYLFTQRGGKVQSTLNILSIDLKSKTVVISRNNPAPLFIAQNQTISRLDEESRAVGIYQNTRPVITEIDLEESLTAVMYTDGLIHAGDRQGIKIDIQKELAELLKVDPPAQDIADGLMAKALIVDQERPVDDISVVVMRVIQNQGNGVRRMSVRLPLNNGR
ncbi:MAG: serine/threonine-protein phosphatase [Anaerolineae bacterium]|nr:serine/threonine-protein phosphatase [Anaerolineae bacterium]